MADPTYPVTPVLAASVILVRDGAGAFEVFMVRRHIKSDFAADVYVFPGGKADARDLVGPNRITKPAVRPGAQGLEPGMGWLAVHMAAIRELFEECGILLAEPADTLSYPDTAAIADLESGLRARLPAYREQVRSGSISLDDLAAREGLRYRPDLLRLFSNWVTPEVLTKRFDTFFFVTEPPAGQTAAHTDLLELTDSLWISPSEALARYRRGEFPLVFATERHLEDLARFAALDDLYAHLRDSRLVTVRPVPVNRDGAQAFVIPGDEGYPAG